MTRRVFSFVAVSLAVLSMTLTGTAAFSTLPSHYRSEISSPNPRFPPSTITTKKTKVNRHRNLRRHGGIPTHLQSSSVTSVVSSSIKDLYAVTAVLPAIDTSTIAQGLGYVVGAGAVLLYTPIAIRVVRQGSADGLTLSTWWLKLTSYTCSILYNIDRGYPFSTYADTTVVGIEAATILVLVAYYQRQLWNVRFLGTLVVFGSAVVVATNDSITPPEVLVLGQAAAAIINVFALIPQFQLNARNQTAGDYSPITAALAASGCAIRLFTTTQLAGSDPVLLGSFGLALALNGSLLLQILYYGTRCEGKSLGAILVSDYAASKSSNDDEEREAAKDEGLLSVDYQSSSTLAETPK